MQSGVVTLKFDKRLVTSRPGGNKFQSLMNTGRDQMLLYSIFETQTRGASPANAWSYKRN